MLRYGTLQKANDKGADQAAQMRRLVCTFVVRNPRKTGFLALRPIYKDVIWSAFEVSQKNSATGQLCQS